MKRTLLAVLLALGWAPAEHVYTRFSLTYADMDDMRMDGRTVTAAAGVRAPLGGKLDLYGGVLVA